MSLTHDYSEMAGKFTSTEEKPADPETLKEIPQLVNTFKIKFIFDNNIY